MYTYTPMGDKTSKKINAAVLGASGFVGAELLRYLAVHPNFEVKYAGAKTSAEKQIAEAYPHLAGSYPELAFSPLQDFPENIDIVFSALPHGESAEIIKKIWSETDYIVDLTADFRLPVEMYEAVYGLAHGAPEKCHEFVTGIPEFFSTEIASAKAVSIPGCYPTAVALALAPLVNGGIIEGDNLIASAASGVSGAGKALSQTSSFCYDNENFFAYKPGSHRHAPEMENLLGLSQGGILFTPHLAPMNRGILATCFANPAGDISNADLAGCYRDAYSDSPFIYVIEDASALPATKNTLGSNSAHLCAIYDEKTDKVIAMSAIDNLGRGAAGQAIQCANIMFGMDEASGLAVSGVAP